jgi:hypothetical protein
MADPERTPDFYVNTVRVMTSAYDLTLVFGIKSDPAKQEEERVIVRMSPQHALVMSKMLQKVMLAYREQIGKIQLPPRLFQDLGLEVE